MKHYGVAVIVSLVAVALLGGVCGWLLALGLPAAAALFGLALGSMIWYTVRLAWRPVRVSERFVTALEMNDGSTRFDFGDGSDTLAAVGASMNRTLALNGRMRLELETSKMYYDRILRVMTHEMRNAITPVLALSEDMIANAADYDAGRISECVSIIREQSAGIKRFLEAYYTLTHLPPPQSTSIDPATFWNAIRELCVIEARQRGLADDTVSFTLAQGMTISADSALLRQALLNLVRNALDAVADIAAPSVSITAAMTGDGRTGITVADNGCGIPERVRPMLFQPFFSTKASGSGVGLCLARQIARLHGGDLSLITTSQRGTTFIMTV